MSGHALYVWISYGVAATALIALLIASLRGLKQREAELERAEAASPLRGERGARR